MITKNPEDIKKLRTGGKILAQVLQAVAAKAKPGTSAFDLNEIAETEIEKLGAMPSFKNYKSRPTDMPFPAALCVSVNDEVVHGLPGRDKVLKEGDIVGLDLGVWYKNLCTDAAITVTVGKVSEQKKNLVKVAKQSLANALKKVRAGATVGDVGQAIQSTAAPHGFEVVRELVGHGVGKSVHEDPEIPCYGVAGEGETLVEGQVIAIEPMVNLGGWRVKIDDDGWTIRTFDEKPSAHFEHTIIVTKKGCEVLTQA